jgi:uncharacterized protein (DUF924 family)
MSDPATILSYWFPPDYDADAETFRRQLLCWFAGGPEVDRETIKRFAPLLEQARRGELNRWANTPRGRLALIIVLDQFSRSVYRDTPLAYAQDPAALQLAVSGIDAGMDRALAVAERMFFVLPLGHSEDLTMQERGVRYVEEEIVPIAPPHLRSLYEFALGQARGTVTS